MICKSAMVAAALVCAAGSTLAAPVGTGFTYQGYLELSDQPLDAADTPELRFRLFDAEAGGSLVGSEVVKTSGEIAFNDGLFTTVLDFGAGVHDGTQLWLEIEVDGEVLSPRQKLTGSPHSLSTRGLSVDADGNVGIGVEDSEFPLHVAGRVRSTGTDAGFQVVNPGNPIASLQVNWLDDVARLRIGGSGTGSRNGLDIQTVSDQSLLRILDNGRVGIGTTAPIGDLHINDGDATLRLTSTDGGTWGSRINLSEVDGGSVTSNWGIWRSTGNSDSSLRFRYDPAGDSNHSTFMIINSDGNVGIGTTTPDDAALEVRQDDPFLGGMVISKPASESFRPALLIETSASSLNSYAGLLVDMDGGGDGNAARFLSENGDPTVYAESTSSDVGAAAVFGQVLSEGFGVWARAGVGSSPSAVPLVAESLGSGDIALFRAFPGTNVARINNNGRGYFNGGTQTGGADVAEWFAVEGDRDAYEPGDLLVISTESDRTVTRSAEPYSTLVAGVYATKPGVLLTERHVDADHSDMVPMGVVGVVPTKVSAENGAIRRGDLLVASATPGHAMKGTDRGRMLGAIIGKALEGFDAPGTGVIRVMVTQK